MLELGHRLDLNLDHGPGNLTAMPHPTCDMYVSHVNRSQSRSDLPGLSGSGIKCSTVLMERNKTATEVRAV